MTDPNSGAARLRSRQQLILLLVLFFGPLLAAVTLYFFAPGWQPTHRTNYGQLISPAQPLPALSLTTVNDEPADAEVLLRRWSYVYVGADQCDELCTQKLYQIRQIRTLLNEKQPRVQRVYVAPTVAAAQAAQAQLSEMHPDLKYLVDTDDGALAAFLRAQDAEHSDPQALYLIDPNSNYLMVYPGEAASPGILKDIKKLLRISQIG